MFNRVESVKILLRANINTQLKNKIGLTALEIAKRTNNIDCSKQINLFLDGKQIGKIEWFFSLGKLRIKIVMFVFIFECVFIIFQFLTKTRITCQMEWK